MRDDMFKVIVERPRSGVNYYRTVSNDYRAAKHFKLDVDGDVSDEFCGTKLPIRARKLGYDGKHFNENLKPLIRYLGSQVGRKWNDVYSEICEKLSTNSTVKQHVRDHVNDYVCVKVKNPNYGLMHYDFFVDDEGILRKKSKQSFRALYKARAKNIEIDEIKIDDSHRYVKINGLWYLAEYCHVNLALNRDSKYYNPNYDATNNMPSVIYKKRSVSKKQLKQINQYILEVTQTS